MRRFIGALVNEHIKILHKSSTIIMAVVIVLVALGYNMLIMFIQNNMGGRSYYYNEPLDQQIANLENSKPDGWEREVERLQFFIDNNIEQFYYDSSDESAWKTNAVNVMFSTKWSGEDITDDAAAKAELLSYATDIETAILESNWRLYYEAQRAIGIFNQKADENNSGYGYAESYYNYVLDNEISPWDWRSPVVANLFSERAELEDLINSGNSEENDIKVQSLERSIAIAEYRIKNDLQYYTHDGADNIAYLGNSNDMSYHDVFATSSQVISIIGVLVIIVAGSAISSEFNDGTVKFLLINPVKRWKILLTKYISILTTTFGMLFVLYLSNVIITGIFFGFDTAGAPFIDYKNGELIVGSSFIYAASKYLLGSVGMICMATFAFALSSLTRNTALSVALGVFLSISGGLIVQIVYQLLKVDWARYLLFANTDLNSIINGTSLIVNHSLSFAIVNIVIYMTVFLLTAWDGFVRRDVK